MLTSTATILKASLRASLAGVLVLALAGACKTQAPQPPPLHQPGKSKGAAPTPSEPESPQHTGVQAADLRFSTARTLGDFPLCEASGAALAPWDQDLVLIADNEQRALFGFELKGGVLSNQREFPLPGGAPRDIEALARLGERLLVVGSFSRNSKCEQRTNRARLMWVEGDGEGGLKELSLVRNPGALQALSEVSECLEALFESPAPPMARELCEALAEAEARAKGSEGKQCETLNIEAAVALPGAMLQSEEGGFAADSVWLGLRSPLVQGNAVLLRLSSGHDSFRFDRVALVDLKGNGLRGLELYGEEILGIAGPMADSSEDFELFSFPVNTLLAARESGDSADSEHRGEGGDPELVEAVQITSLSTLPSSSEGIVAVDGHLVVVVDGKLEKGQECKRPALQVVSVLP